jgi:hypothetical protein
MKAKKDRRRKFTWHLIIGIAVVLVVITFTPLILSPGRIHPKFLSMPFTLWTGIIITLLLVVLTYAGSRMRDND